MRDETRTLNYLDRLREGLPNLILMAALYALIHPDLVGIRQRILHGIGFLLVVAVIWPVVDYGVDRLFERW